MLKHLVKVLAIFSSVSSGKENNIQALPCPDQAHTFIPPTGYGDSFYCDAPNNTNPEVLWNSEVNVTGFVTPTAGILVTSNDHINKVHYKVRPDPHSANTHPYICSLFSPLKCYNGTGGRPQQEGEYGSPQTDNEFSNAQLLIKNSALWKIENPQEETTQALDSQEEFSPLTPPMA